MPAARPTPLVRYITRSGRGPGQPLSWRRRPGAGTPGRRPWRNNRRTLACKACRKATCLRRLHWPASTISARALIPSVIPWLPVTGRRNVAWCVPRARRLRHGPCARSVIATARRAVSADARLHPHRSGRSDASASARAIRNSPPRWPPTPPDSSTSRGSTSKPRSARRTRCRSASCSRRCCTGTDARSRPLRTPPIARAAAPWSKPRSPTSARSRWCCTRTSRSSSCATGRAEATRPPRRRTSESRGRASRSAAVH